MERLIYLTELLPKGSGVSYTLVSRLNNRGLKPKRKMFYTDDIIKNVLSGKQTDDNVKRELYRWVLETNSLEVVREKTKQIKREYTLMESELTQLRNELELAEAV